MKNIFSVCLILFVASCDWRADLTSKTETDVAAHEVLEVYEAVEEAQPEPELFTLPDADIYSVEQKYLPNTAQFRVNVTGKDEITLDVVTGEVKELFGIALNIEYPANLLDLKEVKYEEIFGKDKSEAVYMHANREGNILLGMTSLNYKKSFDLSEGKTLLKLVFTAKSHGSGEIRFYKPKCLFVNNHLKKIPVNLLSVKINI